MVWFGKRVISTETMLEDWESGDKSQWSSENGTFAVSNDTTLFDSYNLHEDDGEFCSIHSLPGDGLPQYWPRTSDKTLVFYTYYPSGQSDDAGMYYGVVDTSNEYFTRLTSDDLIQLVEKVDGTNNTLESQSCTYPRDTILRHEVDWYDGSGTRTVGDMDYAVYNDETDSLINDISATSTAVESFTSNNGEGVGIWKSGGSPGWRHDNLKLV